MSILKQFELSGKTALVTGADTGLGQGMAIALAEAGADIVGASINPDVKGGETEKAITGLGASARLTLLTFRPAKASILLSTK